MKGGRSTCSFKRARCRPRGSSDLQFRGCSKSRDFATSPSRDPHHPSPIRAQAPSTTGPSSTSTSRGRYTLVRCLRRPAVSFKSPSLEIAKSRNLAEISQIATTISRRAREPGPGEHVRTSSWLAVRVSHWSTGRGAGVVVETTEMVVSDFFGGAAAPGGLRLPPPSPESWRTKKNTQTTITRRTATCGSRWGPSGDHGSDPLRP